MPRYKDEEIMDKVFSSFYRNLHVIVFVLGVKILDTYMYWPLAVGIASVIGLGLVGYWIGEKPREGFRQYFGLMVLLSVACSLIAYLTIWLGWVEER